MIRGSSCRKVSFLLSAGKRQGRGHVRSLSAAWLTTDAAPTRTRTKASSLPSPISSSSHPFRLPIITVVQRRSLSSFLSHENEEKGEGEFPKKEAGGSLPPVAVSAVVEKGDTVKLQLLNTDHISNEESTTAFHAAWLWVNDPKYIHPSSGQRLRTIGQFYLDQNDSRSIQSARIINSRNEKLQEIIPPPPPRGSYHPIGGIYQDTASDAEPNSKEEGYLEIQWNNNHSNKEKSYYSLDWLVSQRYDSKTLDRHNDQTRITKDIALNSQTELIPREFAQVMSDDASLLQVFDDLNKFGVSLLRVDPSQEKPNMDDNDSIVAQLGKRLSGGRLSHGALYDDVFHVQAAAGNKGHNLAYTTHALPPHQDLTYYESKPFLQLLHCLSNTNVKGGQSILMDAMAAAQEFQSLAPDFFDILTEVEATFLKQRSGADMISRKPHIVYASSNVGNSQKDVVAVHWSPPFEGPLLVEHHLVQDYAMAYAAFETMLDKHASIAKNNSSLAPELVSQLQDYAQTYTWEQSLKEGQILIFNNQRMLHGRREFELTTTNSKRHLTRCYTNVAETLSPYRLLLRQQRNDYDDLHYIRNAGNGVRGSW